MSEQDKEPTNDDQSKQVLYQENNTPYTSVLKPIRTFEFIISGFLFFLTVYIVFIPGSPIPTIICLLFIILNGIYTFVTALEIIFQYGLKSLPITPMFTFSLLGFLLYFIASLFLLLSPYGSDNFKPIKMTLIFFSFLLSLLFLIDILIVLTIWKSRCAFYKKYYQEKKLLFSEQLPFTETIKRDITTSISTIKISPKNGETIETAEADHSLRKVGIARRREYVDVPTGVPSVSEVTVTEIQTEPKDVTVVESQTCKCELKEVLVQTMSRCEFCNQQLQNLGAQSSLANLSSQCLPCATVIQLLRGGINLHDSDKTEVLQIEEQKPEPQYKKNDQPQKQKVDHKEQAMENQVQRRDQMKDNATQALTSITKMIITVHCGTPYTTMEVTTSTGSKEQIITTQIPLPPGTSTIEKSPRDELLIEQIQEIETKESSIISESVEPEGQIVENEEAKVPVQIKDHKEITESNKIDVKELRSNQVPKSPKSDTNDTASTCKGRRGKEHCSLMKNQKKIKKPRSKTNSKDKKEDIRPYSRFVPLEDVKPRNQRCVEQDHTLNIHEVTEHPHCNRSKIIPSVFQRNNKIDPAYMPECDNYAVQTEDPYFQCIDTPAEPCTTLQTTTIIDVCQICRKEKIPQADIFQYYNIYKDNEGRVYCNLCAPPCSDKVPIIIDRNKDILQECSICGNFPYIIDARSIGVVFKHDEKPSYCMKCGQLQS